jgi:hypothetical protein
MFVVTTELNAASIGTTQYPAIGAGKRVIPKGSLPVVETKPAFDNHIVSGVYLPY